MSAAGMTLCTEQEVADLVHAFYARARQDELLGPVFEAHVADWDQHLAHLVDFWSSILRRTGRFSGAPMPKHSALAGLSAELFQRWLALFHATTRAQPNRAMGAHADRIAQQIAQSLWYGYQLAQHPETAPRPLALN